MNTFISRSPQETQIFAQTVMGQLKGKNVIALYGDLGAGKTTFVQGLAQNLGIKKRVISPSYILMRSYKIKKNPHFNKMHHLDLYRITSPQDLKSIDLKELVTSPKNLILIEWAQKAKNSLPQNRLDLKFEITGENSRKITTGH